MQPQKPSEACLQKHQILRRKNWYLSEHHVLSNIKGTVSPTRDTGSRSEDTGTHAHFLALKRECSWVTHTRCQPGCKERIGVEIRMEGEREERRGGGGGLHNLFVCFISHQWSCDQQTLILSQIRSSGSRGTSEMTASSAAGGVGVTKEVSLSADMFSKTFTCLSFVLIFTITPSSLMGDATLSGKKYSSSHSRPRLNHCSALWYQVKPTCRSLGGAWWRVDARSQGEGDRKGEDWMWQEQLPSPLQHWASHTWRDVGRRPSWTRGDRWSARRGGAHTCTHTDTGPHLCTYTETQRGKTAQ